MTKRQVSILLFTAIEWFDYIIFLGLSPLFAKIFFPQDINFHTSLLLTVSVFSISYVCRPLGGTVMGILADKYNRYNIFKYSVGIMVVSTILMACVPTYSSIGILCLFILLFVRMLQSFSIGAEYSLSFVIMYDHASSDKKYFIPSLINAALAIGVLAATLLIYYLSYMGVITPTSNAWRYIFLFSACMFFASWVFRVKAYDRTQVTKHNPNISLFRVLQSEKYTVIATVAYISFSAVGFYMFSVMSSTTLNSLGYSPLNSLMISSIGVLATIIFIPFWGKIHDLGNPFKLQLYGIVLLFAFSFLHTYLMYLKNYPLIFLGQFIFGAILSINMAALPSYLSKIFAINNRSYLLGFTYNIALVIFGATTPVVIVALSGLSQYMHIIYFGVICIISALGICKLEGGLEIKDISSNRSNHIQPI